MAATNPFKVSDLVAKYGWKVMPYLSNLGVRSLAEAQVLFVDSGHANTLDADDTEHGHSLEKPLATIDYAVGLMTASEGAIILVAPGHAETKAASGSLVTADINGVSIIGLGEGLLRPTLTLSTDTGAIAFTVSAANVTLINMRILVSIDALVSAISVTGTDCKLIDMEVQDNANTTEAAVAILTAATADRLHIERFRHNGFIDGNACTESISLIGVDRAVIKDCWFRGVFSTATINMLTTACTGIIIENCKFENGTEALVSDIVDTQASSVWSAVNCWDVVAGSTFQGGSGLALAAESDSRDPLGAGNTYYVDSDNGVDTNSGLSWDKAKLTIQAAVTVASAYDTIYCKGGASFQEDVTIAVAKYGLKLIGISDTVMFPTWKSTGTTATHLTINAGVVEVHNFHFYGANHTVPFVLVDRSGAAGAYSTLIKNNWFDGANTSDYCIRYTDTVQNKLIGNYIKGFDGTAVGYTGTVQCAQYEITDNNFMDNVNHLVIALNYSVVKGNNFQHSGYANDATIMLDVTGVQNPAIGTTGGNCIIGNYFKDLKADINNANGYYGVTSDQWIGNYCIDGISSGGGAVASSATTNPLLGKRVTRTKSDLMDGTTTTVFTIAGGDVLITALYGTVEDAAHAAVGDTCKFQVNPTTGSATDLCGTTDMTGKEKGTLISVNGVAATALVVAESGSVPAMLEPVIAASGILTFVSGGNDSNATKLQLNLWYIPLDDGATVVVA